MEKTAKIYVAGHHGLVGSAIWNNLQQKGYTNLVGRSHKELDLLDGQAVKEFFDEEQPQYVILAAAHVGGIMANSLPFHTHRHKVHNKSGRCRDGIGGQIQICLLWLWQSCLPSRDIQEYNIRGYDFHWEATYLHNERSATGGGTGICCSPFSMLCFSLP